MAKQRISYVPLEKMDAGDAEGNGTLRARRHAAPGELGGARACAGRFWFFANSWRDMFRNGVLDHADQGAVPAVRVALGAMRVLRQSALGEGHDQRRA